MDTTLGRHGESDHVGATVGSERMTRGRSRQSRMVAADAGAIASSDVAKRAGGVADAAGGRRRVWSQIAPAVPLLPILAIYTFVSSAIHTALNDEPSYLAYAKYLPHILSDDTFTRTDFLWHGPALPGVLYPFVALHVPVEPTRILVGPVPLFAAVVAFRAL